MATCRSKVAYAGRNLNAPATRRSHCPNGHDQAVVGRYANGQCKKCKRLRNAEKAKQAGGWRKLKDLRRRGVGGGHTPKTGMQESGRPDSTNAIIELGIQKDRASTWWDREAIQQQINDLQKRVTA